MTREQQSYLIRAWEYGTLPSENFTTVEYPSGLSRNGRTYLDLVKLVYRVGNRMYIDWIGTDGWAVATENREVT
jgi:hypothetical protein